ncbi:MAG: DUF1836 domain-containing protein [Lachnospiraceae bacterium]|nr:DUF1836 domain-containing protein [Lachnospiraceae bacterium]
MTINSEDLLNSILNSLERIQHVESEDIPNIDLYMDQVTTFMDNRLRSTLRYPTEDKVLTKTMINNYAKNDLLPPPVKKKYSKEHVLLLIFIYYYKGVMSINDIQTLLRPITEKYFQSDVNFRLENIYDEVFSMEKAEIEYLKKDMIHKFKMAEDTFSDASEADKEFLHKFSFICLLSYDVYVKKLIIEKMVDELAAAEKQTSNEKHERKNDSGQEGTAKEKEEVS